MKDKKQLNFEIPVLARVEGEGALEFTVTEGRIDKLNLRIFEPPRFFEKLLEGRHYTEVSDVVARICGICPVAYQMSAVNAIEKIFALDSGDWVRQMRRLMYCGEWIESHALHIHLLAAPDFLGFSDVVSLAGRFPDEVRRGLRLQGLGNRLIRMLGGRSVHPVGVCVGGFTRAPSSEDVNVLLEDFKNTLSAARELVLWVASFELADDPQDFVSVSLRHPTDYPMNEGEIISDSGLQIPVGAYRQHFRENQSPHSTALHSSLDGQPYLVGPLARLNNNLDRLPAEATQLLRQTGITFPSRNMFHSIIARAVEIFFAMSEAIAIMEQYQFPDACRVEVFPVSGIGSGCTEAPRGLLWHHYEFDKRGNVISADIVPPTSQNQARIEQDLRSSLQSFGLDNSDDKLRLRSEKVIRNYDPCISCSTHFLNVKVNRT